MCGGASQRAGAQREEAELRGGPKLREGPQEDVEDGGEGSHPPAANQRQDGSHPTECGERYDRSADRSLIDLIGQTKRRQLCLFVVVKQQPKEEEEEEEVAEDPQEFENGKNDIRQSLCLCGQTLKQHFYNLDGTFSVGAKYLF